jgi:hypothetical protein
LDVLTKARREREEPAADDHRPKSCTATLAADAGFAGVGSPRLLGKGKSMEAEGSKGASFRTATAETARGKTLFDRRQTVSISM